MIAKTKAIVASQRRSPASVPRLVKTAGSILPNMIGLPCQCTYYQHWRGDEVPSRNARALDGISAALTVCCAASPPPAAPAHPRALGTCRWWSRPCSRHTNGRQRRSRGSRPRSRSRPPRLAPRASPDGVIAQPSEPQFSSSQAVIRACRWPKPQGGTAILLRRGSGVRTS